MRAIGLCMLLLLTGCHDEPDFNERFDAASEEIQDKAEAIDAQLDQPRMTEDRNASGSHSDDTEQSAQLGN